MYQGVERLVYILNGTIFSSVPTTVSAAHRFMSRSGFPAAARMNCVRYSSLATILPLAALLTDIADGRSTAGQAVAQARGAVMAAHGATRSLARRAGGRGRALGFATMALPFRHFAPAPALCLGRVLGASVMAPSFQQTAAVSVPSSVRMMSGWKGGSSSSSRRRNRSGDGVCCACCDIPAWSQHHTI